MKKVLLFGILTMVLLTGREVMAESEVSKISVAGDQENVSSVQAKNSAGRTDVKIVKHHRKIRRYIRDHRKHRRVHARRNHKARVRVHVN